MSICMYINNIVYVHTYFKLYTCVWCNSYMFPTCLCQNLCACWVDFLLIHGSRRLPMMAACRGWKMFHKKYGSHGSKLRTLGTRDLLGPCESYSPLKKGYPNFTAICCCKKTTLGMIPTVAKSSTCHFQFSNLTHSYVNKDPLTTKCFVCTPYMIHQHSYQTNN